MRENGFYWVKPYDNWVVAEYKNMGKYSFWMFIGNEEVFYHDQVSFEIDPTPIVRNKLQLNPTLVDSLTKIFPI